MIDQLDGNLLANPSLVSATIPALELLERKPELDLVRDVARRDLRQCILNSWADSDDPSSYRALGLAELLRDPSALPTSWIHDLSTRDGDPQLQHFALLIQAELNSDWSEMERQAAILIHGYPTYYRYYWLRGKALHKLDRSAEAVAPLKIYVHYARNTLDYPRAVALLDEIEGHTNSAEKISALK